MSPPASPRVAVIGGGPAGLMAAERLAAAGVAVDVFERMPTVGRKLLMAGRGGLNITHAESFDRFVTRYRGAPEAVRAWLAGFGPEAVRAWVHGLGIDTFVGSSGKVFPVGMKAAPLLRAWLARLAAAGVRVHPRHRWSGWEADGALCFATPTGLRTHRADAVVLALGGGSWARLGSDGAWQPLLAAAGVALCPLQPSNCGFETPWTARFAARFAGTPLKSVALSFIDAAGQSQRRQGECMITRHGLEGPLIYALSAALREAIGARGALTVSLDLMPDHTAASLATAAARPRGSRSLSTHLQRTLGLKGAKAGLLREVLTPGEMADPARLAATLKALPIVLHAPRPIDEAISTAGGVALAGLDAGLMLHARPGVFCAGEMLDWDAPTGGYLLTACLAGGRVAADGALRWLGVPPPCV
ncbi:MAG: TIGR03862 family flavoprotein [Rhodocyclaceae bacterium]|nr:TIGR03862 family flavoprotein [Rhodocyclaceae bacterium]MCB1961761.1 TIGR03862 family flavoprotein [Rhodocyclaceae bacterium]